jgi:hypothetical protein
MEMAMKQCFRAGAAVALAALCLGLSKDVLAQQGAAEESRLGVVESKPGTYGGYTLVSPLQSTHTYLVDIEGRVVRSWDSEYRSGQDAYLLENGNLLRAAHVKDDEAFFAGASQGGRIQEFTWDGELVWDYKFHDENRLRHHAITRMPNGNIMMIVWERKTAAECIAAGVDPDAAGEGEILVDSLVEVKPNGKEGGDIVWEWHIWDHLIQDHDASKANHGDVAAHPELIDANYARSNGGFFGNFARGFDGRPSDDGPRGEGRRRDRDREGDNRPDQNAADEAARRLQGIGYVGAAPTRRGGRGMPIPDWTHVNGVAYNAKLDQIMISPREFNEVWIIDHSTTTEEAKGHTGGRSGKGGDLLYRWGNPAAYRAGDKGDQRLFSQHDTHWIPEGLPGAGHMLVFNNGGGRPDGNFSSVDEIELPVDAQGNYRRDGAAFGPKEATWTYVAEEPEQFNAMLMSGAQRLANGNTLICTGFGGEIFEVTADRKVVWKLIVPSDSEGPSFGPPRGGGPPPGFGPPGFGPPGEDAPVGSVNLLPGPLRFIMQLEPEQMEKLNALEKQASETLDKTLTADQQQQMEKLKEERGPFDEAIGEILAKELREKLNLSEEQGKAVDALQESAKKQLDDLLTDEQKEQLKQFAGGGPNFGPPGGPGGRPNSGPPGRGPDFGPPGRRRGDGPGFPGMGGVPGAAAVFRSYRYGTDFAGLAGKDLTPGKPLTEFVKGAER